MITLNNLDPELVGSQYLIRYKDTCPFTYKNYTEETIAEIIIYSKFCMFWFDDAYGQESYSYLDEVEILEEIKE